MLVINELNAQKPLDTSRTGMTSILAESGHKSWKFCAENIPMGYREGETCPDPGSRVVGFILSCWDALKHKWGTPSRSIEYTAGNLP
jgi:hypothetical protein